MCDSSDTPQMASDRDAANISASTSRKQVVHGTADSGINDDTPCGESGSSETVTSSNSAGDMHISSVEKVKDTDRRRSKSGKRRSGFSRGRISMTQLSKGVSGDEGDVSGSELYKQIPVDLPSSQRLSLLSRLALRHTLEELDKEFEEVPGFERFKAEALESVGATIDQLETDGTFEHACITPVQAPNPVNQQMSTTISELKKSISRLQQEDTDWDELVSKLESQAQTAEQQLNQLDMAYSAIPDDVKELSTNFLPSAVEMPPLADICSDAVKDIKTISLLMDEYCQSVELLNYANRAALRHMDHLTTTLEESSGCRNQDPKQYIQQLFTS